MSGFRQTTPEHLEAFAELQSAITSLGSDDTGISAEMDVLPPYNEVPKRLETVVEEENSHSERGGRRKHTKKTEEEDKSVALSKKKRNRLGKVHPPNIEKVNNKTKQPKSFHKGKGTGWRVAGVIVKYVRVGRQGYLERAPIQTKVAGSGDTSGISQGDLKEHTGSDFPENTILNSTGSSFNTELQSTTGFGHNTELQSTTAFGHNTEHQNGGPTLDIQPQQYNSISESQISPQNFETKSSEMYHSSNRDHSPSGLPSSLTGRRSADSTRSTSSLLSTGSNSMEYGRPQSSSTPKTYTSGSTIGKSNFKTEESLVTRAEMKPGLLSAGHTVRTTTPDRTHPSVSRLHDSGTGGTPNGSGILDCMSSGIEEDIASSRCSVSSGMLDEACSQIEHRTVPGTQPHYQALEDRGGAEKSGILTPAQQRQENEELRKQLIHESHLKEKAKAELESIQNEFDKLQDFLHHNSDWEGQYQQVQTELKVSRLNNDEKDQMIESLQTEVKSLRNDINSFEKEKSELMMETEELNSKIHSMETQLDEAQHEVKWEENNSMSLESQVESLQIEMSQLKEEYNKVLEDKDSLEGEVLSLTSQMEDANLPIDRSKIGESRAKTPDSQASTASYSNSEDKLATLRSEIKVWKEKHNHLNTEKRIMQKKFETTARELENAKKCVKRLESSAQSMASKDADEVRRLASGKESLEQELKVVKSLAEVRQKQAESLQKELDTLRKLAEDRQKEIRSLQQNLRSSQKLAKGREHEIDSLQQELVGASGLAEDRNRQLEQIVHEMEESKIMAENKHDQLESLQEQLNNINVVAKDKSKEVESLKAELDKATKWAEDKQLELETLEQELVGTTLVAEGRQKQIDSLQTIVAIDLCETSSEHTMESSSHAQKLTLLLAENRANREEIEKLTRDLTVKMKESAADREVNEYLCNEKYKLQSEKTILESELATVKDEYEKYQIQHSADSKIQQAEISGLKAKLNASERLKDTLTSELSHTKFNLSEASESSDKVSSVSYDLASAKVDLENLRKEHSVLNTMLAEERKQCEKLREEWQKELTEKRKLNDQIRDVKIELDTTTATLEASKDYAAQLQEEKDQLYKDFQETIRKLSDKDHYITKIHDNSGTTMETLNRQYEREKHQIEQERDMAKKELQHLRDECELMRRQMDQRDAHYSTSRQAMLDLEAEQRKRQELESQARILQEELNGTKLIVNKLKAEKRSKQDMVNDLEEALDRSTNINVALKQQLKQQRDATSSLMRNKEREQEDLTHNIKKIDDKAEVLLQTAEQNYHAALESKSQIGVDLKMMENTISTLKAQLAEERANRKLAEQKLNSFSEMLEQERKKKAALREDINVMQLKLSKAEATISFEKDRLRKLKEHRNELESKTHSHEYKTQALQDQLNQYQLEVSSLKRQLDSQQEHWSEKNKFLSSELAHKSDTFESERRQLADQVKQLTAELDKMREQVTKKSHDVLKVKRELGEVSLEKEELQTRLSQSQERLTSKERLQQHRSFDDMDLQDGLPNSRRSSIELEFDLHKELQNRPASHSRIYNHYHQQPPSGLSRFEVEQMLLDLSRQIQKQLDQQKDVLKNQSGADENKKLAQLENDLSMEKAFRAVEKLQIQALHDEMNGLRQHLQNIRKSRDTLASERNQQRVLTRMDEINNLIAQSHTRAQTMAFTSMGVSVLDNPIMRMNSREFIQHLQSESPFKTQFTE